jgi:SynChlorMet cassette radical SAM/SPASM protein ScmF
METMNNNLLYSLYYHITNRCNLKCRHCWVSSGDKLLDVELTLGGAIDIIKQCQELGLESVKLTGGEPFVVSWLMDLVGFLFDENLNVTIETNGTLISEDIARQLAHYNNVSHIAISLDGSNASSHEYIRRVPGCFDQTISGIKNLTAVGIRPQILVAVHKGNLDELADIGSMVTDLGLKSIKLNCIHGDGRGNDMAASNETLDEDAIIDLFDSLEELERISGAAFQLSMPLALRPIKKMTHHLCGSCNIVHTLGLLPNGDFALCGIGISIPELTFGNYRDHTVAEIWHGNTLIREIAEGIPDRLGGVCAECIFKKLCRGGCRALAYVDNGSLLGPGKMCQWARNSGKFPESRLVTA